MKFLFLNLIFYIRPLIFLLYSLSFGALFHLPFCRNVGTALAQDEGQ